MTSLTNVSSKKAHKALKGLGFEDHPHCKKGGSHQTMIRPRLDENGEVVGHDVLQLVMGKKEINPFTLKGTLQQGGVPVDEFLQAL